MVPHIQAIMITFSRSLVAITFMLQAIQSIHAFGTMRTILGPGTPRRILKHQLQQTQLYSSADDETKQLLEKAEKLRQEVSEFESSKQKEEQAQEKVRQEELRQKEDTRIRYSATVPILKGDGSVQMERCDFPPRIKSEEGKSRIIAVQASLPLGIVLGQDEEMPGLTTVDDIAEGGNGESAGVKVGDILRACTACQVTMEQPTWQLMAGGIGRPKTTRMMYSTDGKVFEEVMEALISNSMDPEGRPAWLVLERVED